jgi:hypothetical protein
MFVQHLSFRRIGMDVDIVTALGGLPGKQLQVLYFIGFTGSTGEILP